MSAAVTSSPATSRSILNSLLTTYSPAGICTNYGGSVEDFVAYQGQGCNGGNLQDTSTCWPSATISPPGPPYEGWGFYSPGTVCPSGYTPACSAGFAGSLATTSSSSTPSFAFQFSLLTSESAIGCCPIGFTCGGYPQTCALTITSGSYLAGYCPVASAAITDSLTSFQYIVVPGENTITFASGTTTATLVGSLASAVLLAPLFQINFQASDLPAAAFATPTTSSSSISSISSISSSSIGTTPTPIPSPTSTPDTSSSGLSTGAKVAIAVVIPVVVIALVAAIGFWRLRKRKHGQDAPLPIELVGDDRKSQTLRGGSRKAKRAELEGTTQDRQELEANRPELGGDAQYRRVPQELES
ncbi:hypothetical protein MMC25_006188 [Agyrium rufum]|nr:hypothetical protein [Agyrium rufum]